jgi:hypothetical protein
LYVLVPPNGSKLWRRHLGRHLWQVLAGRKKGVVYR